MGINLIGIIKMERRKRVTCRKFSRKLRTELRKGDGGREGMVVDGDSGKGIVRGKTPRTG